MTRKLKLGLVTGIRYICAVLGPWVTREFGGPAVLTAYFSFITNSYAAFSRRSN